MKNRRLLQIGWFIPLLLAVHVGRSQCPNNNIFLTNLTPTGLFNTQTTSIQGGYYVTVNVCAGVNYTATTCGNTAFDTQITVLTDGGAFIGYNDDAAGCGLQSRVTWTATYTGVAWVLVDQYFCNNSAVNTTLSITQNTNCAVSAPPNDLCVNAPVVSCGSTVNGTTVGAINDPYPAGCGFGTALGVWYRFVGNGQYITASLCGSSYDTQISVLSGSCGVLTCVATNDDFCGLQSQTSFLSVTGVNYYILVYGFSGATGSFQLQISCINYTPSPQDCNGATPICNDVQFGGNSSGFGNTQELNLGNQGCLSIEQQSSWYIFQPTTPGTISFAINPTPPVDYDFAIWGPMTNPTCPPVGAPLRCSFSVLSVPTGLGNGATDFTEGVLGDAWVAPITVTPAQVNQYYIMLLDNFTASSTPFVFDWTLSGVVLNCTIMLPVELLSFEAKEIPSGNQLSWITASELQNDYFEIQRSADGFNYLAIGRMEGRGTTLEQSAYSFLDRTYSLPDNYYRLKQVDFNGQFVYSDPVFLQRTDEWRVFPNPANGHVQITGKLPDLLSRYSLILVDMNGRELQQFQLPPNDTRFRMDYDTGGLDPGLYFMLLRDQVGNELGKCKLVVL